MGMYVIACFRPRPGREADLLEVVRDHLPLLRREGLATNFGSVVLKSTDGTLLEIFEWKSAEAVEQAHTNPAVLALWERFEAVCEYTSPSAIPECLHPFPTFERVL